MRLPEPFYERGEHLEIDLGEARVVFTTRRGGFSSGPYATLNLGGMTGDHQEAVRRNREVVEEQLGVRLAQVTQVHGATVKEIASTLPEAALVEADGVLTSLPGVAPSVLAADCLPIAIAGENAVGMFHAGWRGLAAGIIREGVRAIRALANGGRLAAAIGPGAGACCYQVGEGVHAQFASYDAHHGDRLDLKAIAREQLVTGGAEEVHDIQLCTICSDPALLFSHRRDRGVTGRQAGIAWLS